MSGKVIRMFTGIRSKELKQVRVFTTSRALEIELAENDVDDARKLADDAVTDVERVARLRDVIDCYHALVEKITR